VLTFESILNEVAWVSGAWITPDGKEIDVPPSETHYQVIVTKPSVFGSYPKGLLPGQVIQLVLRKGFVQVRDYGDRFQVDADSWTNRIKDLIWDFAIKGGFGPRDTLPVTVAAGDRTLETTIKGIKSYDFENEPERSMA
jgi:hypothetical protein